MVNAGPPAFTYCLLADKYDNYTNMELKEEFVLKIIRFSYFCRD